MSVGLSVNTYGMFFPGSEIERHVLPVQSALSIQTAMQTRDIGQNSTVNNVGNKESVD